MQNLTNVPWLIVAVVLYNVIAVFGGFDADVNGHITLHVFQRTILEFKMVSGVYWVFTVGDLVLVFSLAVLFVELLKATRPGTASFIDHALSLIVFIICLLEFILWPQGGHVGVLPHHDHDAHRRAGGLLDLGPRRPSRSDHGQRRTSYVSRSRLDDSLAAWEGR